MLNIGQTEKPSLLFGSGSAETGNGSSKGDGIFGNVLKSAMVSKRSAEKVADKPVNDVGGYALRHGKSAEVPVERPEVALINNNFAKLAEVKDDKDNERQMALSEILSSILGLPVTTSDIKNVTFDFGENPTDDLGSLMGKIEELLGKEGESLGLEIKKGEPTIKMYAGIKEVLGGDLDVAIKNLLDTEGFGELLTKIVNNKTQTLSPQVLNIDPKNSGESSQNNGTPTAPKADSANSAIIGTLSQLSGLASEVVENNPSNVAIQSNNLKPTEVATVLSNENVDELVPTAPLSKNEIPQGQMQANVRNVLPQTAVNVETIPDELVNENRLIETPKNMKTENLLDDGKNKMMKEGVAKNIADFMNVEKNSAVQSNSEITGATLNKTIVESKTGQELKETLRNEAASKLEILQVKTEASSGGKENPLQLLKPQTPETALDNADKNLDENGFQNYLKESVVATKADVEQNIKEAAQKFDLREPKDISRLIRTLESAAGKGESKLTVSLSPENLGRLEIRLTEIGGKLTARFFTDNETSHKLMISHGEIIRSQLAEKGIVIENMDFGFKDASAKQDSGEGRHSQKPNDERKNVKDADGDLEDVDVETYAGKQTRNNAVYA